MAHRSHEELVAHLNRGRTVMVDGKLIRDPGQLPNPEDLTTGDPESKRRIREELQREELKIRQRLARLEESPGAKAQSPEAGEPGKAVVVAPPSEVPPEQSPGPGFGLPPVDEGRKAGRKG